jgi:signal peptidase II
VFLLALGAALVMDHLTKALVVRRLAPGGAVPAGAWPLARLRRVDNWRLADHRVVVIVCWLSMVAGGLLVAGTVLASTPLAQVALGLAVGGATGNALDVLRGRPVVDFVDLRVWPVFNLADVAITGGVVLTLWTLR